MMVDNLCAMSFSCSMDCLLRTCETASRAARFCHLGHLSPGVCVTFKPGPNRIRFSGADVNVITCSSQETPPAPTLISADVAVSSGMLLIRLHLRLEAPRDNIEHIRLLAHALALQTVLQLRRHGSGQDVFLVGLPRHFVS